MAAGSGPRYCQERQWKRGRQCAFRPAEPLEDGRSDRYALEEGVGTVEQVDRRLLQCAGECVAEGAATRSAPRGDQGAVNQGDTDIRKDVVAVHRRSNLEPAAGIAKRGACLRSDARAFVVLRALDRLDSRDVIG